MAEFAIPDDVNDTLALAMDWKALKKYTAVIRTNHTYYEKFNNAIQEMKSDSRFKLAISDTPEVFADATGNFLLEFSAGNEGVHNYRIGNQSFTWEFVNDALEVSLEGKSISYSFPYKYYAPDQPSPQVEEHIIHDSLRFEKLLSLDSASLVRVNTQARLHYPNGELPDEPFETEFYWVVSETYEKFIVEGVPGRMLLPIQGLNDTYVQDTVVGDIEVNEIIDADILWFSDDGSVMAEQSFAETGIWNITEKGTLKVSLSKGDLEFYKISEHLGFVRFVSAGQDTMFNIGSSIAKKKTNLMDELDIVGIYELPITVIDGYFWLDLQEGGIGTWNSGGDRNNDGVVTEDELITQNLYWETDGERVIVRRYRTANTLCEPSEPDCVLFNERIMHFVELDGKKLYRKNQHKFNLTLLDYPDRYSELDGIWTDDSNSSGYWIMRDEAPLQFP